MKFFACFKKTNKLGAAMVEYAVLLAFVAAVGSGFTSDSGLGSSITGAVGKAAEVITGVESDSKKGSLEHFMDNIANDPDFMNLLYLAVPFNSSEDTSKWGRSESVQILMGGTEKGLASMLGTDQFTVQMTPSYKPGNPGLRFLAITTTGKYSHNNTPSEKVASTVLVYKKGSNGSPELIGTHQELLKIQNSNQYSLRGVRCILDDITKQYDYYILYFFFPKTIHQL